MFANTLKIVVIDFLAFFFLFITFKAQILDTTWAQYDTYTGYEKFLKIQDMI